MILRIKPSSNNKPLITEVSHKDALETLNSEKFKKALFNIFTNDLPANIKEHYSFEVFFHESTFLINSCVPNDISDGQKAECVFWLKKVLTGNDKNSLIQYFAGSSIARYFFSTLEKYFRFYNFQPPEYKGLVQKIDSFRTLMQANLLAEPEYKKYLEKQENKNASAGTEVLGETDEYKVFIAHNKGAACELGKGTDWCTAAPGLNYFNSYYTKESPLVIFINKNDPTEKYQFSFKDQQFMDKNDKSISGTRFSKLVTIAIKLGFFEKYPNNFLNDNDSTAFAQLLNNKTPIKLFGKSYYSNAPYLFRVIAQTIPESDYRTQFLTKAALESKSNIGLSQLLKYNFITAKEIVDISNLLPTIDSKLNFIYNNLGDTPDKIVKALVTTLPKDIQEFHTKRIFAGYTEEELNALNESKKTSKMKIILKEVTEKKPVSVAQLLKVIEDQKDKTWVFFDTETTGLEPRTSQLTEIAAIAVDADFTKGGSQAIGQFHQKCALTPETEILRKQPAAAGDKSVEDILQMNQYFTDNGSATVSEEQAINNFVSFLNGLNSKKEVLLLAHNAKFDRKFISVRSKKYNIPDINYKTFDTLELAHTFYYPLLLVADKEGIIQKLSPKGKVSFTLGNITKALNIDNKNWHSALADTKMLVDMTKEVLIRLEKEKVLDVRAGYDSAMKKWRDRKNINKVKKKIQESEGVDPDIFWFHNGLTDYEESLLYKHANKIFNHYQKTNKNMLNYTDDVVRWWKTILDIEGLNSRISQGMYWTEQGPKPHSWLKIGNAMFDPTALKLGSRIDPKNYQGS